MRTDETQTRIALGCGGLLLLGGTVRLAELSLWIGIPLTGLGAGAAIFLIRDWNHIPLKPFIATALFTIVAGAGSAMGAQRRSTLVSRAELAAQRAAADDERIGRIRTEAMEVVAEGTRILDNVQEAMQAHRLDDARTSIDGIDEMIDPLRPHLDHTPPELRAFINRWIDMESELTLSQAFSSAIQRARSVLETSPTRSNAATWADEAHALERRLRAPSPEVLEYFDGDEAATLADEVAHHRHRYRRMVQSARRRQGRRLREAYARRLDSTLLDRRINVESVRARGENGTTLRIRWWGCSRVTWGDFANGEVGREALSLGFRRLECSSGLYTNSGEL